MRQLSGIPTAPDAPETIQKSVSGAARLGQVIAGRYELRSHLGKGGTGLVFCARDRVLAEDIALKVLLPTRDNRLAAIERLREEVKIARKITHPNVCRVFDVGEGDSTTFLTMELVEGHSLRELLCAGPVQPARALDMLQQIIAGVSAAHQQGVIHRDIKPENVLVRPDGRCVVADFGLAHNTGSNERSAGIGGTPAYMSPEQRLGEPIDIRSDVFALGLLGLELLTGRSPASDGSASNPSDRAAHLVACMIDAHPQQKAIRQVLARAVAERPGDRFSSAIELGAALVEAQTSDERTLTTSGETQRESGSPRTNRLRGALRWAGWGITIGATIGAAIFAIDSYARRPATTAAASSGEMHERSPAAVASATLPDAQETLTISLPPVENLTGQASWDALSRDATESLRVALQTLSGVIVVSPSFPGEDLIPQNSMYTESIQIRVRARLENKENGSLRLFAKIEAGSDIGDIGPVEPVQIDIDKQNAKRADDTFRARLMDEARIAVARARRWRRAGQGTASPTAKEKLLTYYQMIGASPTSEHFEPGIRLLDEALTADAEYVPARIERAFLVASGAVGGSGLERFGSALKEVDEALRLRPQDPEAHVLRCRLTQGLVEREDEPRDATIARAVAACQAALTAAPSSAIVHLKLASLHDRRCAAEMAMQALTRAVELDRSRTGEALDHLVSLSRDGGQMLVAERASSELLAFQEEEERRGPRSLGRRAGAPAMRGAYLARGSVLLLLERLEEAKEAFSRELTLITDTEERPDEEAAALRGLLRIAEMRRHAVPQALRRRLETIEASYRARLATSPGDVLMLARVYRPIDPRAAANWITRLGPVSTCEEAFKRAYIYQAAGDAEAARRVLAFCSPTESWQ